MNLQRIVNFSSGVITLATVVALGTIAYAGATAKQEERALQAQIQQEVDRAVQVAAENQARQEQQHCLALNIYHEARSESTTGKRAVAWVTLNRVQSQRYPDTICDVVYQAHLDSNGNPKRNQCQFSWFCDGKSDSIKNTTEWERSLALANMVMNNYGKNPDPTDGATMYHATYVNPVWRKDYTRTVRIDEHIFYR